MNQYEGMFLFDPTFGSSFENCEGEIRRIMKRADAELVFCKLWDERRLAYRIKGRKRGVYVLTYFHAAPEKVAGIERDARISERILRLLVLRADGVTPETMERAAALRGAEMVPPGKAPGSQKAARSGDEEEGASFAGVSSGADETGDEATAMADAEDQ